MFNVPELTLGMRDAWTLRAIVIVYGLYCALYLVMGLFARLKKTENISDIIGVFKKSFRFLLLGKAGLFCLLVYVLRPVMQDHTGSLRGWMCMLATGHAVYCATESIISYSRMPLQILDKKNASALKWVIRFGVVVASARTLMNIVTTAIIFGKDLETLNSRVQNLDLATTVFNMFGSFVFFCSELYVFFLTKRIAKMTRNGLTIRTMGLLASANILGSLAGFVDIADQYLQIETLEVIVLALGMTALVYYGMLLGIDTLDPNAGSDGYDTAGNDQSYLSREMSINVQNINIAAAVVAEKPAQEV